MADLIPFWAWSWLLTAVGIAGLLLAGSKKKVGWALGLGAQGLWIAYALATEQHGFLFSALAYGSVYLRNWLRWHREAHPKFTITMFSSYPNQREGWEGYPRATASGVGPARVGEEFEHDGVKMVVAEVRHQGSIARWEAVDAATQIERNTIKGD